MEQINMEEYKEGIGLYKFYHDYRMKIFRNYIILNGALLIAAVAHMKTIIGKIAISSFGILAAIIVLLLEKRTI